MIILNETVIIEPAIEADWMLYMHNHYVPQVMATGLFNNYRLLKVLNSPNEGLTYCLQFNTDNIQNYQNYQQTTGNTIKQAYLEQFENRFVSFETILELVDEI